MGNKIWIALLIATASLGCGDDDSGKDGGNNANNDANSGITGGWTATVSDSEVALPAVDAGPPTSTSVANRVTVVGAHEDGAISMTIELEFDTAPTTGEFDPRRFVLTYALPVDAEPADRTAYVCGKADGFMVTVTRAEPLGGTFAGPLTCAPQANPMDTFGANVSGDFSVVD